MRRWLLGTYADHRDRTRREESLQRVIHAHARGSKTPERLGQEWKRPGTGHGLDVDISGPLMDRELSASPSTNAKRGTIAMGKMMSQTDRKTVNLDGLAGVLRKHADRAV